MKKHGLEDYFSLAVVKLVTGETDPRKLPLVIAGFKGGSPLVFKKTKNLIIQDLVVRGSRAPTIDVVDGQHLTFDGLTVYGGSTCFRVKDTHGLRVLHTACRGLAAPWTFRGSLKYRAIESRLFSASGWEPTGTDRTAKSSAGSSRAQGSPGG